MRRPYAPSLVVIVVFLGIGALLLWRSAQPVFMSPGRSGRSQLVADIMMSVQPLRGYWPVPVILGIGCVVFALFFVWSVVRIARHATFELRLGDTVEWPGITGNLSVPADEILGVEIHSSGNFLVLVT